MNKSIWEKYSKAEIEKIVGDYENMKNKLSELEEEQIEEMEEHKKTMRIANEKIKTLKSQQFDNELVEALKEHDKKVEEKILYDIFSILYFQEYNRACNYNNMSGADVVKAQHVCLKEIEKRYNYKLDDDIL